jgi:ABC-type nickel/cobalt efflux system permease component RcnA
LKKKKKKKKKKAIKKAIIKLILLSVLIKLKIMKFFFVVGKLLKLKLVLLVTITTIINIIRFIWEWKSKKDAGKVAYTYEKTHHQHHYDEQHHLDHHSYEDEDKGWLSGLWSRSESYDGSGGVRSIADAHDIAYSAQKPTNTKLRV